MKGITPVVAIILLLLITISMVGFAFVWFTRVSQLATSETEAQLRGQLTADAQKIRIDAATTTAVSIRNTGTQDINTTQISFFIDNAAVSCDATWTGMLTAGSTKTCTYVPPKTCAAAATVKVSAPGNSDAVKC